MWRVLVVEVVAVAVIMKLYEFDFVGESHKSAEVLNLEDVAKKCLWFFEVAVFGKA